MAQAFPGALGAAHCGKTDGMTKRILALNAGSRSHIARLFEVSDHVPFEPPAPVWDASVESASASFDDLLRNYPGEPPDAAGHRVVHPGAACLLERSVCIDDAVRASIESAVPLAPGHNPLALEGIAAVTRRFGAALPQVAVFDTLLGADAPATATGYPIPPAWSEQYGIRRLGFHGISLRDAVPRAVALAKSEGRTVARVVGIHLGNGCSVAGFIDGVAVAGTMGFTPMEGTMMGTRAGSIDPGIIFLLARNGMALDAIERDLNRASGLAAVSGVSADTREVIAAIARGDQRARFALDLYVDRLRFHLGAIIGTLGGIDALLFTGPVGEHMDGLREAICANFTFAGIHLDVDRNRDARPDCAVQAADSRAGVYVIRTLEEWAVAAQTARQLG